MADETRINIDLVAVNNQASTSLQLSEQQLININIQLAKAHKLASSLNGAFKNFQQTGQLTSKVTQWQKQQGNLNVFRQAKKNVTTKTMLGNAQYVDTRTNAIQLQAQKKAIDDQIKMSLGLTKAKKTTTELANETKKVSKNMADSSKHANGFASILAKAVLSLAVIKKTIGFATTSLKASADWTENLNLFEVTFGKASADTMKFALNIQKAYGIGANEIIRYTGLFKQMSEAIGIAENTSTEMSKTLTTLGYDIASLYNISTASAMEKLQAGIAGQTKPLRQLGMDITAQSLDKYLGDMGLEYTSKMLNQADKMLLRTIVIVDQAKNTYGDMAKTINTFSNQVKVLSGSFNNFKLAIGDLIIKPATTAITYLNGFIIAMTNVIRAFVPLSKTSGLNDTADSIGKVDEATKDLEETMGLLSFDKFESLNNGNEENGKVDITEKLNEEFAKKQAEYMAKLNEQMEKIKNNANDIAKSIQSWFMVTDDGKFVEWTDQAKGLAGVIVGIAGFGIVKGILNIKNATEDLTTTMKLLQLAIKPTGLIIIGIAAALLYMYKINEDFRKSVDNLFTGLFKLIGSILTPIMGLLENLMPIFDNIINSIANVLTPILNTLMPILTFISDVIKTIFDVLSPIINIILGVLTPALDFLITQGLTPIIMIVKIIEEIFKNVFSSLTDIVKDFVQIWVKLFSGNFVGVLKGVGNLFIDFANGIIGVFSGIIKGFLKGIEWLVNGAVKLLNNIPGVNINLVNFSDSLPELKIPKFAQGGYPDRGQMFIANEAGAELVGNIGGRTSVANNDMIVKGIEEAAYRGVSRAMSERGGNSGGTVKFEGKLVTENENSVLNAISASVVGYIKNNGGLSGIA
ncbi:MAG: hypothetical protein RRZ69_00025 [Clostridia bacterium]